MKALLIFILCGLLALSAAAQTTDTVIVVKPHITADTVKVTKPRVTDSEFNQLLQSLRKDPESLKDSFANVNRYYTTAQIRKLLLSIPKDSDKLALARSAYDRVTDPDNFVRLADLFHSSTYEREFVLWVQNPDK
jgi:hypothetical protein